MMPSFIKNSKLVYLYDESNKELIYISKSQTDLGKITNSSISNISTYKANNRLYLNQFLFSNTPLNGYTNNLKSSSDLLHYINVIKLARKKHRMEQVDNTRIVTASKLSKCVELTNSKTSEVLVFKSINETARYLNELNSDYKCSAATISDYSSRGTLYKGLFKIKRINNV